MIESSWMILLLPFISFIGGILFLHKQPKLAAGFSILCNGAAMVMALILAVGFLSSDDTGYHALAHTWSYDWFAITDTLTVSIGALLDPISIMMLVVITVISTLVHTYSIGYMENDASAGRFFPLLSFFVFSMLGLVIAPTLVQMFVFWELVGVSSYMLIGFWYHKPSAVAASKKAFIITRFADAFFLTGIILMATQFGSIGFDAINQGATAFSSMNTANPSFSLEGGAVQVFTALAAQEGSAGFLGLNLLSWATILIFIGGWGKSAMFPLHVWLPDAMEGPTPVSSIIHSATMVVAGIYLTARLFPVFAVAEYTLSVVEFTGAITALFAAIIACTQRDIKRILAFSTLSQLGYMMFSLGVADMEHTAGFTASMFHVFTHAFFKCLLFLSAGLIIHSVHSNDIALMGGLRKKLKGTYFVTLLAVCAIAGVPFLFSGFWSKEEIIMAAWSNGHQCSAIIGLLVGGLTAFYMGRYFFLIFHGEYRGDAHHLEHAHENKFMLFPMVLLAIPTIIAGYPMLTGHTFFNTVIPQATLPTHPDHSASWIMPVAIAMAIGGLLVAWLKYGRRAVSFDTPSTNIVYRCISNKFYIDECYIFVTKKIIFRCVAAPMKLCDDYIVDGIIHSSAAIMRGCAAVIRHWQNGQTHVYLGLMIIGLALLAWFGGAL